MNLLKHRLPTVFKAGDNTTKFLNSLHYTDQVVGDFIDKCSKQSWWNNTLVIITGDHGHPLPENKNKAEDFRTPMLWIGGALNKKGIVIDKDRVTIGYRCNFVKASWIEFRKFPFQQKYFGPSFKTMGFFYFQ